MPEETAARAQPGAGAATSDASQPASLLVVGAGPKGLAIAAKAAALRRLGFQAPRVTLVDRAGVAAHWTGDAGYTDGRRILGTLPEKDIGYPYASTCWGDAQTNAAVNRAMLGYSWQSHLLAEHTYADWIDRGRPRPTHREWSQYLRWVAASLDLTIRSGEVVAMTQQDGRWRLTCVTPQGESGATGETFQLEGDGLALTGPGRAVTLAGQPAAHPHVFDGATVWSSIGRLAATEGPLSIGIIGTGETAAAIVVTLAESLGARALIEVISPHGVLYSRDEGFQENQLFSDPEGQWLRLAPWHTKDQDATKHWSSFLDHRRQAVRWSNLTLEDRREFVRRTDRGVFSVQAMQDLTRSRNVRSVTGNATTLSTTPACVRVEMTYDGRVSYADYDYVVVARGFDPLSFMELLDETTRRSLSAALERPPARPGELTIGRNLAVEGFAPRIHLPMLAGVAQGPGFPNLSCLGLLSDRVLRPYTRPASPEAQSGATISGRQGASAHG